MTGAVTGGVAARVGELLGGEEAGVRVESSYGQVAVDLPREHWVPAVTAVRDDPQLELTYFDLLTAVDLLEEGLQVVLHLWSTDRRHGLELRTRCPREDPVVPSLSAVFAGADWHERSAAEMFGIAFTGHPGLAPLLLPDGFVGTPLRKDFLLSSRVAKPWPGAKDPGESEADLARPRRRPVPPGVSRPPRST